MRDKVQDKKKILDRISEEIKVHTDIINEFYDTQNNSNKGEKGDIEKLREQKTTCIEQIDKLKNEKNVIIEQF